ncbi:Uncharacterised protein [Mycobacteroides abscessus subsp. abscessus]|nr:Uncharacterised protein [Mycobacteroides abscessus subsp. abscessus]
MRNTTALMALGITFSGFSVSPAAVPTSSTEA